MYCTALDIIAHASRARLVSQLASNDYGVIPTAEEVKEFFSTGNSMPKSQQSLIDIKLRVEQAITNAVGEINGYKALFPKTTLPSETLTAACMDLALFRLFDNLGDDNIVRLNADKWIAFFDRIAKGKTSVNSDEAVVTGSAETIGSDIVFTAETLAGY